MTPATPDRVVLSPFRVRSYEIDGLGHVNHAVYLNYLEQARYDTLATGGFAPTELERRGWSVHVVRVEIDYRRECRFGDRLLVRTSAEEFRRTSMRLRQDLYRVRSEGPDPEAERPLPGAARPASARHAPEPPRPEGVQALQVTPDEADAAVATGELAVEARIVAVWIGPDGRPMPIPDEARDALASTGS